MLRGLFANRSVRNLLKAGIRPGWTIHVPSGEELPLWRAADRYANEEVSTIIVAGERYGMGSSRDWAAKGVALLGVRAVLAVSFERIHRSNLVNMGVLPLRFPAGCSPATLHLESGDVLQIDASLSVTTPPAFVPISIHRRSGKVENLTAVAALETSLEVDVLRIGGVLPTVLKRFAPDRRGKI